jgi:hypothetical protein
MSANGKTERVICLKLWHCFCKLGDQKVGRKGKIGQPNVPIRQVSEQVSRSGVDAVCSRVCGNEGCQCGSTLRGLHCVWSYYRLEP